MRFIAYLFRNMFVRRPGTRSVNEATLVDAPVGGYTHEDYMDAARAFQRDGETNALQLLIDAGVVTLQELNPQGRGRFWDWSDSHTEDAIYSI